MVRVLGAEEPVSSGQPAEMHTDAGRQAHCLGPLRPGPLPVLPPRPILSSAQPCSPEFPYVHPIVLPAAAGCSHRRQRLTPWIAFHSALAALFATPRPKSPPPLLPAPLAQARVAAAPSSFRTLSTSVVRKGASIRPAGSLELGARKRADCKGCSAFCLARLCEMQTSSRTSTSRSSRPTRLLRLCVFSSSSSRLYQSQEPNDRFFPSCSPRSRLSPRSSSFRPATVQVRLPLCRQVLLPPYPSSGPRLALDLARCRLADVRVDGGRPHTQGGQGWQVWRGGRGRDDARRPL